MNRTMRAVICDGLAGPHALRVGEMRGNARARAPIPALHAAAARPPTSLGDC
jgi:hypothetical protein